MPSDQLTFHGPVPVSAAAIAVEPPLQMAALPLTTEVGRASAATSALPVISLGWAEPLASDRAVTV